MTYGEGSEPFAAWLPTYADIIHNYEGYGFPGLEIDSGKFPLINGRRAEITTRFYERYASRMVNKETLPQWQLRLQNRFDEVAPEFERAFRLYEKYSEQMENDMLGGYKHKARTNTANSGKDTVRTKNTGKTIDTPDSAINADPNYADTLSKDEGENETSYGSKNDTEAEITHTVTGAVVIENLNLSITSYKDIDTEFIAAFENNFLNIFWS